MKKKLLKRRNVFRWQISMIVLLLLAMPVIASGETAKSVERVDVYPQGEIPTKPTDLILEGMSSDGRYCLLSDMSMGRELYLRDMAKKKTAHIAESKDERGYNEIGPQPISANGRYIVFESDANDLVDKDTNKKSDIFLYDSKTGSVKRINLNVKKKQANKNSISPVISGNGRYVYYYSSATNLTSNGKKCGPGYFRYDIKTKKTIRLPLDKNTGYIEAVSKSGRYIVSAKPTKKVKDKNLIWYKGYPELYRYDVEKKEVLRIPNPDTRHHKTGGRGSSEASISGDGRYIVFLSSTKKDDGNYNVFLFDCKSKKTKMVNRAKYPKKYGTYRYHCTPSISPDGRYISYFFVHYNFGTDSNYDLYIYDRVKGKRTAVAKFAFVGGYLDGEYYYGDIWNDRPWKAFTSQKARYISAGILQYVDGYASYRIKVKK